ncbi:hypothetical protein ACS0TY_006294 [Phlomoides rotata]
MIEVDDEGVLDASGRVDPHVKGLRYKSWPYYAQWIEIFCKDMAIGENSVDPIDLTRTGVEQEGDTVEKYILQVGKVVMKLKSTVCLSPLVQFLKQAQRKKNAIVLILT